MRIVAGEWRGRTLGAPPGSATRPTADRVRQALFDMLLHASWAGPAAIEDAHVLDAFAGTGALGLEALSRGAAHATFIERDAAALAVLRANIAHCGATGRSRIVPGDALHPPRAIAPCGLVFLDPPYASKRQGNLLGNPLGTPLGKPLGNQPGALISATLSALQNAGWLAPGALIVAETARIAPSPHPDPLAERTHGAAKITVWRAAPREISG